MSKWPMVRFEELAASDRWSFSIGPFGSKVTSKDYLPEGVPFIRGVNLSKGRFHDEDFVYISEEKAVEVEFAEVQSGDIVFTRKGTIGQVSIIPSSSKYQRYIISGSQVKARVDPNISVPEFYYYWFSSPLGQASILSHVSTTGVPSLANSLASVRGFQVPVPQITEQEAIVNVLEALDDKITVNDRIAKTIEQILAARFEQIGVIGFGIGESVPVSELVDFNPRESKPKSLSVPYIDMAALPTNSARIVSIGDREPKSGAKFRNGDTLLARITPCLENGKTGYVDLLPEGEVGIGSTEFIVMRAKADVPKQLPYFIARNESFREHAIRNMEGTSGRQRVAAANISDFLVRLPDATALKDFGDEAERGFRYMEALDKESRTLAELRDTLLPRLMSGELRVKDAEEIVEDVT